MSRVRGGSASISLDDSDNDLRMSSSQLCMMESDDDDHRGGTAASAVNYPSNSSSSSSYKPRFSTISYQSGTLDKSNIIEPLNLMKENLLSLLTKLRLNKEGISDDVLQRWKDKIAQISKKIIILQLQYENIDVVSNNYLNEFVQKENENSNSNDKPLETLKRQEMIQDIYGRIEEKLKSLNILDDNYYQKVLQMLKKIAGSLSNEEEEEEEDFEILDDEEEWTENIFLCPYTKKLMTDPVKK
jgi:hypothetical protein